MLIKLILGARKFHQEKFKEMQPIFEMLSGGQHPDIFFISCSDSRVVPSLLTNSNPGEMFVHRNVGNIIPPFTSATSSEAVAIEFALNGLGVKNIILCGHSCCGAMEKLLEPTEKSPTMATWLNYSSSVLETLATKETEPTLENVIKQNILVQLDHLKTYPLVAERLASGKLTLHGWFYNIKSGEIFIYQERLKEFVNLEQALNISVEERKISVIKKVTMDYLSPLTQPKTADDYLTTAQLFSSLKFNLKPIWPAIKPLVAKMLWEEIGGLYSEPEDKAFTDFVETGVDIKLEDLTDFQKELQQSAGYHLFCSQLIRKSGLMKSPSLLDCPQQQTSNLTYQ
ncbi:carbonic anhydrase [Legionella cardiaca]|uniref:carbonic anhydrase n=1 Tax=Legionella cardiaca TaxID=1071983 RepID=A0ABY8AQI3_9GAMM|nr:carbonic anhydrase [Legionella cardiaca]WED42689.1 carbonic anhydrase [Legionella cardiaca]